MNNILHIFNIVESLLLIFIIILILYRVAMINVARFDIRITNLTTNTFIKDSVQFLLIGSFLVCLLTIFNENLENSLNLILKSNEIVGKMIILFFSILAIPYIELGFKLQDLNISEIYILYLGLILSFLNLISSKDLIDFYLAAELQTLIFFVFAGLNRNSIYGTESSIKYFLIAALFSGFLLFGISLIYITLGTVQLSDIEYLLKNNLDTVLNAYEFNLLIIGVLFIFVTLLFKFLAFPFHFWAIDVYQGVPLAVTLIFLTLPKFALIFFSFAWFVALGDTIFSMLRIFLTIFGLLSILVGTLYAIQENSLKRIYIYSSIVQTGFFLIGFGELTDFNSVSTHEYAVYYMVISLIIWGLFILFSNEFKKHGNFIYGGNTDPLLISNLRRMIKSSPKLSFVSLFAFFSIAGVPPFAIFFLKVQILYNSFVSYETIIYSQIIAIFALFIAGISTYYYLKIIKQIFFDPSENVLNEKKIFLLKDKESYSKISNKNTIYVINLSIITLTLVYLMTLTILPVLETLVYSLTI